MGRIVPIHPYDMAMTVNPPPEPEQVALRVSDVDRGRALARLQQAQLEGRLTGEELEQRIAKVQESRTYADLDVLLADLPAEPGRPHSDKPVVLRTVGGKIKRNGDWPVARRIRVDTGIGSAHLDFTETPIPYDQVDIEVHIGTGSVRLTLPAGATADLDELHNLLGSVKSKVPQRPTGAGVHFKVAGTIGTGSAKVSYRRRGLFGK